MRAGYASSLSAWSFLFLGDSKLASFYSLVLQTVRFDGVPVELTGLNNMITLPGFRGTGLASTPLNRTVPDWSESLAAECGLLLCSDDLLGFYSRLGWHQVNSSVRFTQPLEEQVWQANCMVLSLNDRTYEPEEIDLCGLAW